MEQSERTREMQDIPVPARPIVPWPWWAGDILAVVFIVTVAFLPFPAEEYRPIGWLGAVFVILPALLLPLRRRWPILVLIICLLFYGAVALTGTLSPGIVFATGISVFGAANRSGRRGTLIIAGAAIGFILLVSLPAVLGNFFDPRVFQFALAVAFAASAGDGARSRREYIVAITERAERAEQTREAEARRRVSEERLRIARDLHDTVAHQIAVISLNAGVASSSLAGNPDRTRQALATIRQAGRQVLAEIGDLLSMLRSEDLPGTPATPQYGLSQVDSLLERFGAEGLSIKHRIKGKLDDVGGTVGLVAYRVVQEGLANAHKHGAEDRAHLMVQVSKIEVKIVITNPVRDRPVASSSIGSQWPPSSGLGLVGLRERVASVRGTVNYGMSPGGWKLAASLPLPKDERA